MRSRGSKLPRSYSKGRDFNMDNYLNNRVLPSKALSCDRLPELT